MMQKKRLSYKICYALLIGLVLVWIVFGLLGQYITDDFSQVFLHLQKITVYTLLSCIILLFPSNLKISLITIIMVLVIFTIILNVYGIVLDHRYPESSKGEALLWEHNDVLGWKIRANYQDYYVSKENRYKTLCQANSKGLRDEEYSYDKDSEKKRILLLGDSVAVGLEVDKEDVVDVQLEKLLAKHRPFEVINAGVRGYGTDQSYLFFTKEGYKYHPDIVIYLFVDNDPLENVTIHKPGRMFGKSYFVIGEDGELKLQGTPVPKHFENFNKWTMSDKKCQDFYNQKKELAALPQEDEEENDTLLNEIKKDMLHLKIVKWVRHRLRQGIQAYSIKYLDVPKDVLDYEWMITEKLIESMGEFSDSLGVKFMVYEFTANGKQQQPTRLENVCDRLEILYANSFDEFKNAPKTKPLRFHYDGHWNANGHHLAAEGLYNFLNQQGWI